jgi:hypothetical protein
MAHDDPSTRFEQCRHSRSSKPRSIPAVVVELDADVAFEHGRWRHPTALQRLRPDLAADDLPHLRS